VVFARSQRGVLLALLLAAAAAIVLGVPGRASTAGAGATAQGACGRTHHAPAARRHVIWIWMENHNYDAVAGSHDAPFTNSLAAACGLATNYHNVSHPSLPNYIAATSGGTHGITDDCQPSECPVSAQSLFGQLDAKGASWRSFQESMQGTCSLDGGSGGNPGGEYAPKHNPAVYYLPLRGRCRHAVVPLGTPSAGPLAHALGANALPAFSFVTPNLCNDTHDCPVAKGDAWLQSWMTAIIASPAYRAGRTTIFVTWDEGEGGGSDNCAANTSDPGCHVVTIVVSPSTPRGTRQAALFSHYSLLKTTEQLLGIRHFLGHANDPGTRSMRAAFHL
jgi:phosphatidylinositol-3-phosphatase